MDAIRKQLDKLMGANRNGDALEVTRRYYDRDVRRLFLAGLCPHDLFQLTKMDMGPCPKLHSLQLPKEYEEAKAKGMDNYGSELEETIERLIVECERRSKGLFSVWRRKMLRQLLQFLSLRLQRVEK